MKTHAFALSAHTISNPADGDKHVVKNEVFELPVKQFQDFEVVKLVRAATKAEIAAANKKDEADK